MNVFESQSKSELRQACVTTRFSGLSKKINYHHVLPIGGGLDLVADSQTKAVFVRNEFNFYFYYCDFNLKEDLIDIAYDITNNILSEFDPSFYVRK